MTCGGDGPTSTAPAAAPGHDGPSNIVFVLVDDLGWMDLGVQGNEWYPTPNIDRLAARGLRFTDAYAASPVCSPSRAAMMSGISGARTGITDFIPGHWRPYEELTVPTNRTQYLPPEYTTYAESLQDAGYETAYFGKWHLGWGGETYPGNQGFDTFHVQKGWGHFVPPIHFGPTYPEQEEGDYLTDLLTDMTVNFITDNQDDKFAVVCSHFAVHVPLAAPDELVDAAGKRAQPEDRIYNPTYVAMVQKVDEGVGRIMDHLDSLGLTEKTLFVFGSDNGGLRQIFNKSNDVLATDNAPLRDEKGSIYEGGIRVPFILSQPGTIAEGTVSHVPTTGLDLYPTFLDVAQAPAIDSLDGESLQPLWLNEDHGLADRTVFFHYPHYHHGRPAAAIRRGNYKLIKYFDRAGPELYQLADDLGETTNLYQEEPAVGESMLIELENWLAETNAPVPVPNPDFNEARRAEWGPRPKK
ncbi:hypothetical protein A3850_014740 [Lewinella sp. 4G2]|nr:hypothetical protein A3850_014740 [Lewinella sp. 4G2]